MGTIIKLKAAVNNNNLPILGNDGKITDYYVGRLRNKIMELGGTVTDTEVSALTALVENGRTNGWLDKVAYFLPFIGSRDIPFSGAVPLIDRYGDWNMDEYTGTSEVTEDLFAYDSNDRIKSLGYIGCVSSAYLKTPVKASDIHNSLGTFIHLEIIKSNTEPCTFSTVWTAGGGNAHIIFRSRTLNGVYSFEGVYGSQSTALPGMTMNSFDDGDIVSIYNGLYSEYNGSEYKGYITRARFIPDETPTIGIKLAWSYFDGQSYPDADRKIFVGRKGTSPNTGNITMPIKTLAIIDPTIITKDELTALDSAIRTFNTSLGR